MDYCAKLAQYARFGIHLGLERINHLLANLNNPHLSLAIVHIAGTNGKGSVCAYLSTILAKAGYRVGRYTSPHLRDWRERITINDRWISAEALSELLAQVESAIDENYLPTQFEVFTAVMWLYFAQQKVDLAVIETGLGGRLDATNVHPQPLVTAITSISRDHWQRLGDSIDQIAAEKAGIIKRNRPLVISELHPSAEAVIISKAKELNAPIIAIEPAKLVEENFVWRHITYNSSLQGEHQLLNSAIVLGIIQSLQQQGWQISIPAIQLGMANTNWAGRLQWTDYQGTKILLDGAHNSGSAIYLRRFVDSHFGSNPVTWIIGIIATKDPLEISSALIRSQDFVFTVPVPDHDTIAPQKLAEYAHPLTVNPPSVQLNLWSALDEIICNKYPNPILCGSLYLLGYFLSQQAQSD
jgi:dihydrofolate synthase/folylpolyglutamate synthase